MNEERWLVSYADFITLLFAFFVVMFASSQVDKKKIAVMASTFDSYVNGQLPRRPAVAKNGAAYTRTGNVTAQALTMAQLAPAKDKLEEVLLSEILAGQVELSLQPRGLVLSLKESAFFAPGQDAVSPGSHVVLGKVAEALRQVPGSIRLEGHTDDTPIRNRKFPSNWHLSIARSVAVLKLLTQELDLPPERLAVAGYGEYRPLDSNQSPPGRSRNRRVDLILLTQAAEAFAPR
jgi:chemotaxis protein MotB